jgi:hypothetical protein
VVARPGSRRSEVRQQREALRLSEQAIDLAAIAIGESNASERLEKMHRNVAGRSKRRTELMGRSPA